MIQNDIQTGLEPELLSDLIYVLGNLTTTNCAGGGN